jgi:pyrroline-5-carboxylate reductase
VDVSWTLGFVGGGVMAEMMIGGLLEEGVLPPDRVMVSNRRQASAEELAGRYGVRAGLDNGEVGREADVLVLAVKPQTLHTVLRELAGQIRPDALVISIIAGERVRAILGVMGQELRVDDEGHVDRATAVNGTGPAIVAEFVKAMFEAATYVGQPRHVAHETVLATLLGTAELIRGSGVHVAELIDEVTSPGGTTSRALQVLKQGRFGAVVTEAVDAAYGRTLALGEALDARLADADSEGA